MNNYVYANLKFARENFNYGVRELASIIGIDPSAISKYELGKRGIPNDLVNILSKTLDSSYEFIMQESDYGLYAYYNDKKITLSIEQYNVLSSKNQIEVKEYKRIIKSDISLDTLKPIVYSI